MAFFEVLYDACVSMIPTLLTALSVVGTWLLFEKADEKGWKALIPFYGDYILFKIAGKKKWFILHMISFVIACVACSAIVIALVFGMVYVLTLGQVSPGGLESVASVPLVLALILLVGGACCCALVARYQLCKGLRQKMSLSTGLTVGLFFLPEVFVFVLGADKQYVYPRNDASYTQQYFDNTDIV